MSMSLSLMDNRRVHEWSIWFWCFESSFVYDPKGKHVSPYPGYCSKPKMWAFFNFLCVVNNTFRAFQVFFSFSFFFLISMRFWNLFIIRICSYELSLNLKFCWSCIMSYTPFVCQNFVNQILSEFDWNIWSNGVVYKEAALYLPEWVGEIT